MKLGRREFIIGAASTWVFILMGRLRAFAMGVNPEVSGVARLKGVVKISGKLAEVGTLVAPGDTIVTGVGAHVVFVFGQNAFLVRENAEVIIPLEGNIHTGQPRIQFIKLKRGGMLSVFKRGPKRKVTLSASVAGVRGTALYTEVQEGRDYICTCYGSVDIESLEYPDVTETVKTRYHDSPRFIYGKGATQVIEKAPVINHTDVELIMLEKLVGRKPPFTDSEVGAY